MSGFETGMYRNLFAEIGKSQEEIERKLQTAAEIFFHGSEEERIFRQVVNGGSVVSGILPARVREEACRLLDNGNAIAPEQTAEGEVHEAGRWVRMYRADGSFAGIYAWEPDRKWYRPVKMFLEKE